jgi:tyrosinase
MTTRREILLHGAIGVGVLSSNISGVAALAQTAIPKRRSLQGLAWNDPIVATYRDAVGIMKQKPASDKFNWAALSTIHGTDPDHYHFCPHGDWYFLPWHRAFTAMYERIIRSLTHNNSFAMPYWDWTTNPLMPQVFLNPKTPDGKTNWLCVTDPGWTRTWPANKPMPPEIVGPQVLNKILTAVGYENFGTSRNPRQNNLDPKWVPAGGGAQGTLEATPHNNVHNNVGGWMPTASSSRDPLFFMHHSNIDRIWALWNLKNPNSTDPLWTGMTFTNNFWNVNGTYWSPKVSDLYVPEKLGYTYGLGKPLLASPKVVGLTNKLTSLFATAEGAAAVPGIATVSVANAAPAAAGHPLEVAINVSPAALAAVRARPPVNAGLLTESLAAREEAATGTRALAFLRDVMVTDPHATMFRIFVDGDGVSASTPITDPHYVGTFGVFHSGGHDGHGMPSFVLDLTDALQRTQPKATGSITLQIVPVNSDGGAETAGTATPSRIEVSFVTT